MKATSIFVKNAQTRRFIIKNSLFLSHRLPILYIQSFMIKGQKERSEIFFYHLCRKLNRLGDPLLVLGQSAKNLRTPLELSPIRMGKKIKMIPRISGEHRQCLRGIFVLSTQIRTRKFVGKSFLRKVYREIVSSVYISKDSFRRSQQAVDFVTGYLNLRYLHRRWF